MNKHPWRTNLSCGEILDWTQKSNMLVETMYNWGNCTFQVEKCLAKMFEKTYKYSLWWGFPENLICWLVSRSKLIHVVNVNFNLLEMKFILSAKKLSAKWMRTSKGNICSMLQLNVNILTITSQCRCFCCCYFWGLNLINLMKRMSLNLFLETIEELSKIKCSI